MMKYEQWEQMSPEKKFQAARWESNAETNNATTKQDFKNIVKYLITLIEKDECPSCQCKQVTPIKATNEEFNTKEECIAWLKQERLINKIEVYKKALETWDQEAQITMVFEEMSELQHRVIDLIWILCEVNKNIGGFNLKKIDIEELADYLIQNATEAFEHQDRELLIKALERCDILKTEKI